jgi:HSP20 family molecular chaperone IbpA
MSSTGSRSRCPGCSTSGGPYCRPSLPAEGFTPLADLEETDDTYLLEVELPGIKKKDINIEVEDRLLVISGKRTEKERTGWLRRQTRSWGRFRYEVVLPDQLDEGNIEAILDDGVLQVRIPKGRPVGATTSTSSDRHQSVRQLHFQF